MPSKNVNVTHTSSSSTKGKLMKPTSCPIPWSASKSNNPLLAALPRSNQSAAPSPFAGVAPHSPFLVFSAYPVTGKKPDVHVFGEKNSQSPAVVSVYWGY